MWLSCHLSFSVPFWQHLPPPDTHIHTFSSSGIDGSRVKVDHSGGSLHTQVEPGGWGSWGGGGKGVSGLYWGISRSLPSFSSPSPDRRVLVLSDSGFGLGLDELGTFDQDQSTLQRHYNRKKSAAFLLSVVSTVCDSIRGLCSFFSSPPWGPLRFVGGGAEILFG